MILSEIRLPGLPPLSSLNEPDHVAEVNGQLTIGARAGTDWVINPMTQHRSMDAPALLFPAASSCFLSCLVRVPFRQIFDAGALVVYQDDKSWAKLCFELSPQQHPTIVSVVTREFSDECSSADVSGDGVYLRLMQRQFSFAFHYSLDGDYWHFIRRFALRPAGVVTNVGFLAQSPRGAGTSAMFSNISYVMAEISDIRSGE